MATSLRRVVATLCAILSIGLVVAACGTDETGGTVTHQNQDDHDAGYSGDAASDDDADDDADTGTDDPADCSTNDDCEDDEICVRPEPGADGECVEPEDDRGLGEPCTDSEQCESGLCYDETCTTECDETEDCPDDWLCRDDGDVGVCEIPTSCTSDGDCSVDDDRCVVDRNGEVDVICRPPVGDAELGDSCSTDDECSAGLCFDGECSRPCDNPSDCGDSELYECTGEDLGDGDDVNICQERPPEVCATDADCDGEDRCVATVDDDEVLFACGTPNEGGGEGGDECSEDADCAQNLCEDDACLAPCDDDEICTDIPASECTTSTVERDDASGSVSTCEVPTYCLSTADCGDDETCYVISGDESVETVCNDPNDEERADGEVCSSDDQCASNYCHEGRFDDYCQTPCELDEDCPDDVDGYSFECAETDIEHGSGTETIDTCQRTEPEPCSIHDDCDDGLACAVVTTADDDGLETVCMPDNGGAESGAACNEDDDCLARLCTDDTCADPCVDADQCIFGQHCADGESVSKDDVDDELDVCTEIPEVACTAPVDCDYDDTTCNLLSFDGAGDIDGGICGFENPGQNAVGDTCSDHGECESDFCWPSEDETTGECTVFCEDAGRDCGGEQVCVPFSQDLNTCHRECLNNETCDGDNVCQYTIDGEDDSSLAQFCDHHVGDGETGDECSSSSDCQSGTCLTVSTHDTYPDESCSTDADCDGLGDGADFECSCAPGDPNCDSSDWICVSEEPTEQESRCSELCDPAEGDDDCLDGDHELTRCSDSVQVNWNGNSDTIAACSTE